jgi:hypothetical protein
MGARLSLSFLIQEIVWRDSGLFKDRPESAFRHIAGMVGDGGISISLVVVPDFMAASGLTVKGKAECLKTPGYFPVPETG